MGNEQNNTCKICNSKYHLCRTCEQNRGNWHSWRMLTDTEEHYQIYAMLIQYDDGTLSKEDARDFLKKCDISDMKTWNPIVKKQIQEIMKEDSNTQAQAQGVSKSQTYQSKYQNSNKNKKNSYYKK